MSFNKTDRYNQPLHPGDICVYDNQLVIYKKESWGGEGSKGEYGKFITTMGTRSIKYKNVIFAFDPMGERRNKSDEVRELCRKFYEG